MKVRELLTDESKWCKMYAVRRDGDKVSFCLFGALIECYPNFMEREDASFKVEIKIGEKIPIWNDAPERTFAEVKQLVEDLDI